MKFTGRWRFEGMRIGRRQGERYGGDAVDALHCVGTSGVVVLLLAAVGGPPLAATVRHRRKIVQIGHAAAQMALLLLLLLLLSVPGGGHGRLGPLLGLGRTSAGAASRRLPAQGVPSGASAVVAVVAVAAVDGHAVVVAARDVLVEESHDVVVQSLLGHVARQTVHVVGDVAVGVLVQQRTHSFERAFAGRQEQRSFVLCRSLKMCEC